MFKISIRTQQCIQTVVAFFGWNKQVLVTWKHTIHTGPYIKEMLKLHSGKLTVRPWQSSGFEDWFPLKMAYFQGPTVNLPGRVMAIPWSKLYYNLL